MPMQIVRGRGPHYAMVPAWLAPALPAQHRANGVALYAALNGYVNGASGAAWPSRETLADDIGKSVPTVARVLTELADVGAIERTGEQRRGSASGNFGSAIIVVHFSPAVPEADQ